MSTAVDPLVTEVMSAKPAKRLTRSQLTFRRFLRQSDTKQKIIDLLDEADQAGAAR